MFLKIGNVIHARVAAPTVKSNASVIQPIGSLVLKVLLQFSWRRGPKDSRGQVFASKLFYHHLSLLTAVAKSAIADFRLKYFIRTLGPLNPKQENSLDLFVNVYYMITILV